MVPIGTNPPLAIGLPDAAGDESGDVCQVGNIEVDVGYYPRFQCEFE